MAIPRLKKVTKFEVSFTADDWELYSMQDRDAVAMEINAALVKLLNHGGLARREVEADMMKVLDKFAKFGAADTEPVSFLMCVLEEAFA